MTTLVALIPLFRADFAYIDDQGRVLRGYDGWDDFSRYASVFLSHIIHASSGFLRDISPLTQILAVAIVVAAALILLREVRVSLHVEGSVLWALPACVLLVLCPYFLECLSYKYDAPYMAFSIFAAMAPLSGRRLRRPLYCALVCAGTLLVCTTYQAASGVFPMAVLFLAALEWNRGEKLCSLASFVAASAGAYVAAMLAYKLFFMADVSTYVSNSMAAPAAVVEHYLSYISYVKSDFDRFWNILILVMCLGFVGFFARRGYQNGRNALLSAVVGGSLLVVMFLLSFGLYPFLSDPLFSCRALYGVGAFVMMVALGAVCLAPRLAVWVPRACAIALAWCFITFAAAYGNALAQQKAWEEFRIEEVVGDLSDAEAFYTAESPAVQLVGSVGYAPALSSGASNKMMSRLVPVQFRQDWSWGKYRLFNYYGLDMTDLGSSFPEDEYETWSVVSESSYHIIYNDGERFVVVLR